MKRAEQRRADGERLIAETMAKIEARLNPLGYTQDLFPAPMVCMPCGSLVHMSYEATHTATCPGRKA